MFKYIKEAERFYEEAIKELEKAKEAKDEVRGRDACDKAWLSVIKATEALFIKRGVKEEELPKGYRSQRYLLSKYAGKDLRGTFHISRDIFHIAGYYEGML